MDWGPGMLTDLPQSEGQVRVRGWKGKTYNFLSQEKPSSTLLLCLSLLSHQSSLVAQVVRHLPIMQVDPGSILRSGRSPGEENDNALQYSCLEKSHGRRGLAGYSCKESDTTEQLHFLSFFSHSHTEHFTCGPQICGSFPHTKQLSVMWARCPTT